MLEIGKDSYVQLARTRALTDKTNEQRKKFICTVHGVCCQWKVEGLPRGSHDTKTTNLTSESTTKNLHTH